MNTKRDAVYHFHRRAEFWKWVAVIAVGYALMGTFYVYWIHVQLANCFAGG